MPIELGPGQELKPDTSTPALASCPPPPQFIGNKPDLLPQLPASLGDMGSGVFEILHSEGNFYVKFSNSINMEPHSNQELIQDSSCCLATCKSLISRLAGQNVTQVGQCHINEM